MTVNPWSRISLNRDRVIADLHASGLCEKCATAEVDAVIAFEEGRDFDEIYDELVRRNSVCGACREKMMPKGACCQIMAALYRMRDEAEASGAGWGDEETFKMVCAVIEGWRPGQEN